MEPQTPAPGPEQWTDGLRLHVAAAAHRVGVAPSTLRTWDRRYGIGPTGHTPGRHRRYSPDDLARLDLMHRALTPGATPADAAAHAFRTFVAELAACRQRADMLDRLRQGHEPDRHGWCSHPAHAHRWERYPCTVMRLAHLVENAGSQARPEHTAEESARPTPEPGVSPDQIDRQQ